MLKDSFPRGLDRRVWLLCSGRIISTTGFSIVLPFLAIHLNRDLALSMGEVGMVFLVMAVAGAFGQILGGELADRIGRRPVMFASMGLRGLVFLLLFGAFLLHSDIWGITILLSVSNALGSLFDPASSAMIADIVEPGRRLEAYGILRIGQNIGWTLGPLISGLTIILLPFSYLFLMTAMTCSIVGLVILLLVKEPARVAVGHDRFHPRDLLKIWHNKAFFIFCLASLPLGIILGQLSSTFSVFCVKDMGIPEAGVGYMYALNGIIVVLLQFPMTRLISHYRMPLVLSAGSLLYALGYFLVGLTDIGWVLLITVIIITLGENTVSPSSTAMVASLSPEDEKGRYMGVYGIFFYFGWSLGPTVGGVLYDLLHGSPFALWSAVASIAMVSVIGFLILGRSPSGASPRPTGRMGRAKG
jgi:MFS family permease